jgi:hypothetical protein
MSASDTTKKKTRTRRSPEKIAELILEAERKGNNAEICRREGINPQQFSRWKSKAKEAMIQGLKEMKRGRKSKESNAAVDALAAENERLRAALCDQTIELTLLKKSVSSDYKDR